jgi:hypothetical protein
VAGTGAPVGAGDLDRFGFDHQVADGEHVALADQHAAAAALRAQALRAARVGPDLCAHAHHGVEDFFGFVLGRLVLGEGKRCGNCQQQEHRAHGDSLAHRAYHALANAEHAMRALST